MNEQKYTQSDMLLIEAKAIYLQLHEKMTRKQNYESSYLHICDLMFKRNFTFKQILSFFKRSRKKYSSFKMLKLEMIKRFRHGK